MLAANCVKSSCFGAKAALEFIVNSFELPPSTNFTLNLSTSFAETSAILKLKILRVQFSLHFFFRNELGMISWEFFQHLKTKFPEMVLKILISLLHWCFLSKTIFLSCKTISINFRSFLHFSICLLYTASSVLPSVRRICWISTYKWFQNDAYWFLLSFSQSESRTKIINLKSCLKAVFIVSSKPNFIDPGAISYFRLDRISNQCELKDC